MADVTPIDGVPFGMIFAGVGGQGTLTLAQIALETARRAGYNVLQSEIHGMSQRGGMVNAHVSFSRRPVTSPVVEEGRGNLLIALEPLEALRYVRYLHRAATLVVSRETQPTIPGYPEEEELFAALEAIPGAILVDTASLRAELKFPQAAGTILLGVASTFLPFERALWDEVVADRFQTKGEKVIARNHAAFSAGVASVAPKATV